MTGTSTGNQSANYSAVIGLGNAILNPPKPHTLSGTFMGVAKSATMDAAVNRAKKLAAKALGPWGILLGPLGDKIGEIHTKEKEKVAYLIGIKHLSEKQIPGFEYREMDIGGKKIIVAVDATSRAGNPNADPYVWTNADDPENPALKARIAEIEDKAKADIEAYRLAEEADFPNKKDAYKDEILRYLDKVGKASSPDEIAKIDKPKLPSSPGEKLQEMIVAEEGKLGSEPQVVPNGLVSTLSTPVHSSPVSP